nr:LOW QUALITY PROTEIN: uncharacterized protein LOC121114297 [Lepeophtheirus salmonis]
MANLQLPLNQDHEVVLGSEYCSGYKDPISNEWHTGFYCPASDESENVFCCGSSFRKYCCTKKDKVLQSEIQDLTILIGIIVGASAAIMIITLVSCFCCSCCILYKKRNSSSNGSMYRFHNASEHSGVTNMYSLSGGASRTGTPQLNSGHYHRMMHEETAAALSHHHRHYQRNGGMSHSHTLPHNLSHHSKNRQSEVNTQNHEQVRAYGTLGRMPRERPPPYHDLPASAYLPPPQNVITASVIEEMSHSMQEPLKDIHPMDHNVIKVANESQQIGSCVSTPPPPEPHQILFSNAVAEANGEGDEEQLFHSTKF